MNQKLCRIVAAGERTALPFRNEPGVLLLAADAGYLALTEVGLVPDLAVGDFDSLGFLPEGLPVLRHPAEKDDTDLLLAVREGFSRGCTEFEIYCALGGRLDHTLANLQTLAFIAVNGGNGVLFGKNETVYAVRNGTLSLPPKEKGVLSVFANGKDAVGVTLTGLKYPLSDATLTPEFPLGVSNEYTGRPVTVSVKEGTLLVIESHGTV